VAAYVYRRNSNIIIHGMWGFQASQGGAKAIEGTDYNGIPPNVLFAHLVSSDNPLNFGLGSYRWQKAPGNTITNLILDHNMDLHPGDGNLNTQNMFLAKVKRVVEQARCLRRKSITRFWASSGLRDALAEIVEVERIGCLAEHSVHAKTVCSHAPLLCQYFGIYSNHRVRHKRAVPLRSTIWIGTSRMRECDIRIGGEQASRQFAPTHQKNY